MEIEIKTGYYNDGKICYEYPTLNGKYHGIQKDWHQNGKLNFLYLMISGKKQKTYQCWHDDGDRMIITNHKNDSDNGPFIRFKYK